MAYKQQQQQQQFSTAVATLLGVKNKATANEMVAMDDHNNNAMMSNKIVVEGAMLNTEEEGIMFYKSHNWAGKFAMNPRDKIFLGTTTTTPGVFVHEGKLHPRPPLNVQSTFYGSSGAVVYGNYAVQGEEATGRPLRGWLLAWSALDNEHHVYVETGLLDKMININMDEVREKLEKSGTTSYYLDRTTGAEASATITPAGSTATLGSVFGVKRVNEISPNYVIKASHIHHWNI